MSLQSFDSVILSQDLHLAYSDGIEFCQPFGLRHPLIDEHRIQVLQIGQADQLRDIGVVTDIPFQIGMAVPPLLCSHTEQGHVQHIGFTGIHHGNLLCGKLRRNQVLLDSICMDAVIDLGQISLDVPAKLFHFLGLEPLKLLDQIQFEFDRDPRGKLEGNLLVSVGSAIAASFGDDADSPGLLHPFLRGHHKAVQAGLTPKRIEFDTVKRRVV